MSYLLAGLLAITILLFTWGLVYYLTPSATKIRLTRLGDADGMGRNKKASYFERRIRPWALRIVPRFRFLQSLIQLPDTSRKLVYAGYPMGLDQDQLLGLQVLAALAMFVLGLIAGLPNGPFLGSIFVLVLTVSGIILPLVWLDARATERQRKITLAVPEALELLSISVQAGLNLDAAVEYVAERLEGPLAEELGKFMRELRMGIPRPEAFRRLAERNRSEELRAVVESLAEARALGVPFVKTLKEQADEMRVRRIQRAKETGARAGPKITLVTAFLVAPSAMCLMLSVLIFHIVTQFGPQLSGLFGGG